MFRKVAQILRYKQTTSRVQYVHQQQSVSTGSKLGC
jgi:hypothetical protein